MSTDELRTAAIEAAATTIMATQHERWDPKEQAWVEQWAHDLGESIVDAVLPLIVAGTASRIADAIEATSATAMNSLEEEGFRRAKVRHAAIARRVGESNG